MPLVFACRPVERKEHLVAAHPRVACAVLVLDEQCAGFQCMLRKLPFSRPRAGEVSAVDVVAMDGQYGVCKLCEGDVAALVVADDGPVFHHVHIGIGEIVEFDVDGVEWVGEKYCEFLALTRFAVWSGIIDVVAFPAVDEHLCGEVAVGMAHSQAGFVLHVCGTVCGVEREMAPIGIGGHAEVGSVGGGERGAVINEHGFGTLDEFHYETGCRSAELHLFGGGRKREQQSEWQYVEKCFHILWIVFSMCVLQKVWRACKALKWRSTQKLRPAGREVPCYGGGSVRTRRGNVGLRPSFSTLGIINASIASALA